MDDNRKTKAELDCIMESEPCAVLPKPFTKREFALKIR